MSVAYEEERLNVSRTARWGRVGNLTHATTDLWVVLHGYGQLAGGFAASAAWPTAPHRAFVFPEALQRFYLTDSARPNQHADAAIGASWMTRESRDDDIADNHAYLDALVLELQRRAPRAMLSVLGFSQGAHTAARWAAVRALAGAPPARLVVWGGVLPPGVPLDANAPLRRVPTTLVHGSADRWATPDRVAAERARIAAAGFPVTFLSFGGGHRLDDITLGQIANQ